MCLKGLHVPVPATISRSKIVFLYTLQRTLNHESCIVPSRNFVAQISSDRLYRYHTISLTYLLTDAVCCMQAIQCDTADVIRQKQKTSVSRWTASLVTSRRRRGSVAHIIRLCRCSPMTLNDVCLTSFSGLLTQTARRSGLVFSGTKRIKRLKSGSGWMDVN